MNLPPKAFLTLHKIAEQSPEEAVRQWYAIERKTIEEFLLWLIRDSNLTRDQLTQLKESFDTILRDRPEGRHIIQILAPLLTDEQKRQSYDQYAAVFLQNLESALDQLTEKMSPDQRQVANSYTASLLSP